MLSYITQFEAVVYNSLETHLMNGDVLMPGLGSHLCFPRGTIVLSPQCQLGIKKSPFPLY